MSYSPSSLVLYLILNARKKKEREREKKMMKIVCVCVCLRLLSQLVAFRIIYATAYVYTFQAAWLFFFFFPPTTSFHPLWQNLTIAISTCSLSLSGTHNYFYIRCGFSRCFHCANYIYTSKCFFSLVVHMIVYCSGGLHCIITPNYHSRIWRFCVYLLHRRAIYDCF